MAILCQSVTNLGSRTRHPIPFLPFYVHKIMFYIRMGCQIFLNKKTTFLLVRKYLILILSVAIILMLHCEYFSDISLIDICDTHEYCANIKETFLEWVKQPQLTSRKSKLQFGWCSNCSVGKWNLILLPSGTLIVQ